MLKIIGNKLLGRSVLFDKASRTIRNVSWLTPHFDHGWALGVIDRYDNKDNSKAWAGEFLEGYTKGWFEADDEIGRIGDFGV